MNVHIPRNLIRELRSAKHVAVLTGAGTSAESGIPTFREAQTGLWAKYDPQELATPQAFRRNPHLVWDWYVWRRSIVMDSRPNDGHFALAQMETCGPKVTLITQNVDGFHQQAGSTNVLELHGNIMRTKCSSCSAYIAQFDDSKNRPPHCPVCQGLLRPDVVWYGENLPRQVLARAFTAVHECDIFFSVGTSAVVHPAASMPVEALQRGIPVVEINPQRTPITSYMTYVLSGPSGLVLPELVRKVWLA